jgi:hypothetical protein
MEGDVLCSVTSLKRNICHRTLSTRRAICGRRSAVQVRDGSRVLVHGAAGLLGRHAGLGYSSVAGHLGLHVFALGLLLRGWRGSRELLRRVLLLLGVHSLLLLLLEGGSVGVMLVGGSVGVMLVGGSIRVLVVHGRLGLASDVRRLGVLLHGNCEVLVGDWNRRIKCDEAWLPCRDQRKGL